VPYQLFGHTFAPNRAGAAHTPEDYRPRFQPPRSSLSKAGYPIRHGDGSNVTSLPAEVHNRPVPFALLKVADG
jgi:hypothetical protein